MKPRPQRRDVFELFQAHFDQMLNPDHPLLQLAEKIDWPRFDVAFAASYSQEMGAPAKAIRLMVGLHYLKYTFNESDESLVARWVENPYWQAFCGYTHMQHACPIHPTSMTKWRHRVGADRLEVLLTETIDLAVRERQVSPRDLRRVNVDTTVQEKHVTFPTDSKLLDKAIVKLVAAARSRDIRLRQSYVRVGKRAAVESVTGVAVTDVYVDKGYRGHDYTGSAEVHVAGATPQGRFAIAAPASAAPQRGRTEDRSPQERPPHGSMLPGRVGRRRDQRRTGRRREQSAQAARSVSSCADSMAHRRDGAVFNPFDRPAMRCMKAPHATRAPRIREALAAPPKLNPLSRLFQGRQFNVFRRPL